MLVRKLTHNNWYSYPFHYLLPAVKLPFNTLSFDPSIYTGIRVLMKHCISMEMPVICVLFAFHTGSLSVCLFHVTFTFALNNCNPPVFCQTTEMTEINEIYEYNWDIFKTRGL